MERRQFPRVIVHLPAVFRSASHTVDTYVCNISQHGLGLLGEMDLSPDELGIDVEIALTLPGQSEGVIFEGQLIWCARSSLGSGLGVRFHRLQRATRLALANFLIARCSGA